jgi:protein transport protein SEC20
MEAKLKDIATELRQLSLLIARLGNSPGPAAIHQELQAVIRDNIQSLSKGLEYAQTFVEDEEDSTRRAEQRIMVLKYSEDLENRRILYRKAILKAKRNLESSHATNRNLLFDGRTGPSSRRDEYTSNAVLQASSDVTSELRRAHEMMSNELSKSALSQELLEQSSKTLGSLHEEYTAFQAILVGSKRLLKELENADKADRIWIWASLSFFLTVVAWILYRRILSKGINILVWLFGGMLSGTSSSVTLPAMSIATSIAASVGSSTIATSLAASITSSSTFLTGSDKILNTDQSANDASVLTINEEEAALIQNALVNDPVTPNLQQPQILNDDNNIHDEL